MPSIRKRGNTYRIMVSLGYDLEGKQIRKTTTFTPPPDVTEGKAEKLATAFAYDFEKRCRGMVNLDENIRFVDLATWYYEEIAIHKLKPKTFETNRYMINTYVMPYIGHVKLKDINTAKIDALFNELFKNGRRYQGYAMKDTSLIPLGTRRPFSRKTGVNMSTLRDMLDGKAVSKNVAMRVAKALGRKLREIFTQEESGGGLSAGSIKRVRSALSPIFSTAVKKELLLKNPVTHATTPRGPNKDKAFLDAEQCRRLLTLVHDMSNPQLTRVITMLLYTGMRIGEITGLHWQEVNLENATLQVKYNLYRLHGEYRLSSPKTKSSARLIALPPQVIELLKEQKAWQEQRKKDAGNRWLNRGAVFTGEYGEYMNQTYVNSKFKELIRKHHFPDVSIHDLRHANASLLINMGVPVKVISEHLGHCDTRTTEKVYAHIFEETMTQASSAISEALSTVK